MATILFFLFITLFSLVFPRPLEEQNRQFLNPCPPVKCGKLGEIKFPFTNTSKPTKCGAFFVDGCSKNDQWIQLPNGTGKWYDVKHISQANTTIFVADEVFKKRLASNSCEVFENNMSLPNLTYASFQINPRLNLHKCNVGIDMGEAYPHAYWYKGCNGFNIYYGDKIRKPYLPPNCSLLELPGNTEDDKLDIFHWLTAEFSIQVHFNDDSYQQYILNGQSNLPTSNEVSKGNKHLVGKLVVALAFGCSTIIAVICLLIFFIRHRNRRKKYAPSDFFYANSPDPPLSLEPECTDCLGVPIFSYAELQEATNNFDRENKLANGGFGTVYYGKLRDGREVAVKRLNENNPRKVKQFLNEIAILTQIRHPNLVKLYGCTIHQSRNFLLVYEYVPNGTVADHLHGLRNTSNALTWPTRMRIAIETATALAHLHASGIIHRDVSTRNILLDENLCVKVADFGLSRLVPKEMSHVSTTPQGSPGYLDPGYYYCCRLSDKSDVYSFGVVLSELISSLRALDSTRHRDEIHLATFALNRIQKCAFDELIDHSLGYKTNEEVTRMTTSVAELAFLCLQQDSEMRPRMDEVLEQLKGIQSWGKNGCFDASQKEEERPIDEDALLKNTRLPCPSISETAECSPWMLCYTFQTEAE